jgi:protein-tyrosine phosphatase
MHSVRHNKPDENKVCGDLTTGTSRRFVDIHCHCLPNLDDGPGSLLGALALCRALVEDDIGVVVATPHQLGRFETQTHAKRVFEATRQLNHELSDNGIDLRVLPGAEVRLDERINQLLAADEILTLADMDRHVLLELPNDLFIDIEPLLVDLRAQNVEVVIAHAERNAQLLRHLAELERWLAYDVTLQVTAGSLTGQFGPYAYQAAWKLVIDGWATLVATDAHDCGSNRRPCMTEAYRMIQNVLGDSRASLLCAVNPRRAVEGKELIGAFAWSGTEVV